MEKAGYVRLDADYLVHVRPHLTDREARVYEAVILACDGWDRPTTTAAIASITRLHVDHVRKAMRSLEQLALIACKWHGARTSPNAQRSVVILRDYAAALRALQALGRIGPEQTPEVNADVTTAPGRNGPKSLGRNSPELRPALGRNGPKTLGQFSPETLGQIGPEHLISRSDPDPSIPPSQPSHAAVAPSPPSADVGPAREGGAVVEEVPSELVELCRGLWGAEELPVKAARRYLAKLLPVGAPMASASEIAGYLRVVAKTHRVKTAGCPIAVACIPEEFAMWLERRRIARVALPSRASPLEQSAPLSSQEIGRRAAAFAVRLARCPSDEPRVGQPAFPARETKPEVTAHVGT